MQWGEAGRGSEETAAGATLHPQANTASDEEGPQMLTLLVAHLSEQQRASRKYEVVNI